MSIYTHRTLIIVTAADRDAANRAAASLPGATEADLQTFTAALSPTGAEPATHYVCSGVFDDMHRYIVEGMRLAFPSAVVVDYDLESEPERPALEMARLGVQRIETALPV